MTSTATPTDNWTKRSVVSSFIMKTEHGSPRVALFQRSDRVSTYQHHWGPISGTISRSDPTPLAAAWREMAEETTLTPASLSLLRQGKPFTFRDASVRREWTIFPFLFQLKHEPHEHQQEQQKQIQTDWEHEAWAWHDPDAVIRGDASTGSNSGNLRGVPRLAESLRRVWFENDLGPAGAGKILAEGLDVLGRDHESGARQLAGVALQVFRDVVARMDGSAAGAEGEGVQDWWAKVRFAAWHLWKNGRESMGAAILSALLAALARVEQVMQQKTDRGTLCEKVRSELNAQIAERQDSATRISQAFVAYLEKTFASKRASHEPICILTLSESSTIRQGLRDATEAGFALDLRILESRPLYEGVSLGGSLTTDLTTTAAPTIEPPPKPPPHSITIYTDASAALASSNIDLLVLGADRIAASGAVSNKTGSLPAALSAKHASPTAQVVVLGESDKIAPPGRAEDHVVEDNDASQVSRAWRAEYNSQRVRDAASTTIHQDGQGSRNGDSRAVKLAIRNIFFEWVPASLVDTYVMESGEWTTEEIAQHSAELEAEEKRLFGSL
ncbi:nagb/rpia/CoA transferase-like protein [Parathielavia hyrcaniae]|uniref:Nagb/rpia/CoA transferase-like protein n=1 Tax=Parathielavia hyrcaniae TaxID=113614 RepID=A0AAN6SYJ5_9PEZI|nr:nagb/rpia/CoA transferase-like protein [Parathielavia hyrcaniae]